MTATGWARPREKVLVGVALALAALVGAYHLAWTPLAESRQQAQQAIGAARTIEQAARQARSAGGLLPAAPALRDSRPIATRVTTRAEAFGLSLRRLEPEGGGLRVTLEDARFDDVIGWIAQLEAEDGLRLTTIELDRRTEPGVVSTTLMLEDTP